MIFFKNINQRNLKEHSTQEFLQCKLALHEQGSRKSIFVKLVLFQGFFFTLLPTVQIKDGQINTFPNLTMCLTRAGKSLALKFKKKTTTVSLHFQMILSKIPLQCNYVFIFRLTDIWHSA